MRHLGRVAVGYDANASDIPEEILRLKWNWGAFAFGFIWGAMNGLGFDCLAAILGILLLSCGEHALPFWWKLQALLVAYITGFALYSIYVGRMGHRLAWRYRKFESLKSYFFVQRCWMFFAFVWLGLCGVAGVYLLIEFT